MNRYYTVMLVPESEKGVKSFRVPRFIFFSLSFLLVLSILFLGILGYNYIKISSQVYENKHLTLENRQLKEQIQLFQVKINSLTADIKRIQTFESKLRTITGADYEDEKFGENFLRKRDDLLNEHSQIEKQPKEKMSGFDEEFIPEKTEEKSSFSLLEQGDQSIQKTSSFKKLKQNYDQQIAANLGIQTDYSYTKEWSDLTKRTLEMSSDFALFDYKYKLLKGETEGLESSIHQLDQFLLNKESFLKSTPTILPTRGWITSYYGPRQSPYSGRLKMHEGIDIGARTGTKIIAPADGVITFAGRKPGFGNFVQIDHGYGVESIFGHASKILTKKGTRISRGDDIAMVGNTGLSTGPHLHYEVRVNGIAVDPFYFVLD